MQSKSEKVFKISVDFTLQWETSRGFPQKRWQIWGKKKKVKVNQSSRRKCATATGKISFPLRRMLAMQPFPWPARAPALREISSDHDVEHGGDDHDGEDDEDNDDNRWHCHPSHDPCLREAPSSDAISVSPILVTTSPILPSYPGTQDFFGSGQVLCCFCPEGLTSNRSDQVT